MYLILLSIILESQDINLSKPASTEDITDSLKEFLD